MRTGTAVSRGMAGSGDHPEEKGCKTGKEQRQEVGLPRYSGGGGVMKFPMDRPVKVVMLGAGGTGGYVAPMCFACFICLAALPASSSATAISWSQRTWTGRTFVPADLGENKARVLAERYSTVLGMETEYVPNFIEKLPDLMELIEPKGMGAAPPPAAGQRKWCCCSAAWITIRRGSSAIRRFIRVRNLSTSTAATEIHRAGGVRRAEKWTHHAKIHRRRPSGNAQGHR